MCIIAKVFFKLGNTPLQLHLLYVIFIIIHLFDVDVLVVFFSCWTFSNFLSCLFDRSTWKRSWITNKQLPISLQLTYCYNKSSVADDKLPLNSLSEIICQRQISFCLRIEPAAPGLLIRCIFEICKINTSHYKT